MSKQSDRIVSAFAPSRSPRWPPHEARKPLAIVTSASNPSCFTLPPPLGLVDKASKVVLDLLPVDGVPPPSNVLLATPDAVVVQVAMRVHRQTREGVDRLADLVGTSVEEGADGKVAFVEEVRTGARRLFCSSGRVGLPGALGGHSCCSFVGRRVLSVSRLGVAPRDQLAEDGTRVEGANLSSFLDEGRSSCVGAEHSQVALLVGDEPDVGPRRRVEAGDVGRKVGDEGRERLEGRASERLREGRRRRWW